MKITSQSADELVLQEGSASGIVVGVVFALAGGFIGYRFHAASPMAIWIALAVFVVGVVIILLASSITVNANKRTGQLLYQKKRLIGAKNSAYALADVLRIETRRQWRMENRAPSGNQGEQVAPQPMLVSQSVIVFKNGQEVPLDHQKTASTTTIGPAVLMSGQGKESAMANQVAAFLNVPFQEIAPPAMGMGMGGGININIP